METYYVNKNAQPISKDHEVHVDTCSYLPAPANRLYLGEFATCEEAVEEAKETYSDVNGCYYCSNDCHTT